MPSTRFVIMKPGRVDENHPSYDQILSKKEAAGFIGMPARVMECRFAMLCGAGCFAVAYVEPENVRVCNAAGEQARFSLKFDRYIELTWQEVQAVDRPDQIAKNGQWQTRFMERDIKSGLVNAILGKFRCLDRDA